MTTCWRRTKSWEAKGVTFTKEAPNEFYGMNTVFADGSGTWFSLGEERTNATGFNGITLNFRRT